MQPSQQMCSNARVGVPPSSRIQAPATRTMSILPLGSFGRQWRPVLSCEPDPLTVRVVLRHVEIDRPRTERVGHRLDGAIERVAIGPVVVFGQNAVFGRVVAHREEQRVRHVGLKAERPGAVRPFRAARACASSCACRPSRFRLRRRGARRGPRRSSHASRNVSAMRLRVAGRIFRPLGRTGGRIDANDAVGADAEIAKVLRDARMPFFT